APRPRSCWPGWDAGPGRGCATTAWPCDVATPSPGWTRHGRGSRSGHPRRPPTCCARWTTYAPRPRHRSVHEAVQMSSARVLGLLLGFVADRLLGDPRRGHPVAGFGTLAARLEARLYADSCVR